MSEGALGTEGLQLVTSTLRRESRVTMRELTELLGVGRTAIDARLTELARANLFTESGRAESTGGRAPRAISFNPDAGRVLVAELNSESLAAGVADLEGRILRWDERQVDVLAGPEEPMRIITEIFERYSGEELDHGHQAWGIGLGVLGPVDEARGRPVPLAELMRAWADFPVAKILAEHFRIPAWIENEVNLMALGEHRTGMTKGHENAVLVKISKGIGAGLISRGTLMRGAGGAAGEIGHVYVPQGVDRRCWCGNTGCLFTVAGELSLEEDANDIARRGESDFLARARLQGTRLRASVIGQGAARGDAACVELLERAGAAIGFAVASTVNIVNPSIVVLTGTVPDSSGVVLSNAQRALHAHALSVVATNLPVVFRRPDDTTGLVGAALLAIDGLFQEQLLRHWLPKGSPVGLHVALQPAVHSGAH